MTRRTPREGAGRRGREASPALAASRQGLRRLEAHARASVEPRARGSAHDHARGHGSSFLLVPKHAVDGAAGGAGELREVLLRERTTGSGRPRRSARAGGAPSARAHRSQKVPGDDPLVGVAQPLCERREEDVLQRRVLTGRDPRTRRGEWRGSRRPRARPRSPCTGRPAVRAARTGRTSPPVPNASIAERPSGETTRSAKRPFVIRCSSSAESPWWNTICSRSKGRRLAIARNLRASSAGTPSRTRNSTVGG